MPARDGDNQFWMPLCNLVQMLNVHPGVLHQTLDCLLLRFIIFHKHSLKMGSRLPLFQAAVKAHFPRLCLGVFTAQVAVGFHQERAAVSVA